MESEYSEIKEDIQKLVSSDPGTLVNSSDFGKTIEEVLSEQPFEQISEHGYRITEFSTNHAFGQLMLKHKPVRCIICNLKTSKHLRPHYLGRNIITINKSVPDDVFYFNKIDGGDGLR